MDTTIIGFEYFDWNWEEKGLKGTSLFITVPKPASKTRLGNCYQVLKCDATKQKEIFGTDDLQQFIGKKCRINYNRYGKVSQVEIIR